MTNRLKELEQQLKCIQLELKTATQEMEIERREARALLKPRYHYTANVRIYRNLKKWPSYFSDMPDNTEYIVFTGTLQNANEFHAHRERFGCIMNPPDEKIESIKYFRFNNVLLHEGAGTHILKKKVTVITDEEWENLKVGNIPSRLLR